MCGIAGAVGYVDAEVSRAVEAMNAAQYHRGPDAGGTWSSLTQSAGNHAGDECGAVLAHRRLAILDLSDAGAQPMIDPASGSVIVFNGEVYNFMDIRRDLEAAGETFVSHCDTEVVLRAIVKWGIDAVKRFRGMFALAVWQPHTRQLHLVRDRVGIKPLYIAEVKRGEHRTLLFSSELRAMLQSGLIDRKIDPVGLATYFWNGFVYGPSTMVRDVTLLPAGTSMTIEAGQAMTSPKTYWHLPAVPNTYASNAVDELQDALEEAVKLRLIADVPLGVFLSGGIDSSAVAALAMRSAPDAIHTFNIGFDDVEYDESRYAQAVAEALGTQHTCLRLSEAMFRQQLDDALQSIDQPTFDGINTFFVSQAVRQAGVTVALAGTGGDELFGGYRSFEDIPRAMAWSRALRHVPVSWLQAVSSAVARVRMGSNGTLPAQTRWGKLGDAFACRGDMVDLYQVAYAMFTHQFLGELAKDVQSEITQAGRAGNMTCGITSNTRRHLHDLVNGQPQHHGIATLELASFIGQRLMRDTDAASMAVALEARVPLLDHRVIECAAAVDPRQRFQPLRSKHLLRQLALNELDPALFDRPKSGFVLPMDRWCRQGLREQVNQTLHDEDLCRAAGVNPVAAAKLVEAFQSGQPGIYWTRLWMLFVLLWWCREHRMSL